MVLILSDKFDSTTTQVIDWLDYYKLKWLRLNGDDKITLRFVGKDIEFLSKNVSFLLSSVKGFWYRRGLLNIISPYKLESELFNTFQNQEFSKIIEYIYYFLNNCKSVNSIEKSDANKLIVSSVARKLGLNTPKDLLFSDKNALDRITKKDSYITKTISGNTVIPIQDYQIFNYTSILKDSSTYTSTFFPSFVQNYVSKKLELRIFYFKKKFYSMAIFSQTDDQTAVDFRNYNKKKPNRTVPFQLPLEVENKLTKLMDEIDLDCGSIDMILNNENEYVFLEVNPIGQFGMVSYPCNYNLEKIIAEFFL